MNQRKGKKKAIHKAPPRGGSTRSKAAQTHPTYTPEMRLKIVRMHLDEGHDLSFLSRETGVSVSSIANWIKSFKAQGEAGLGNKPRGIKPKTAEELAPVKEAIIEVKNDNPEFGVKRISQFLRRMFFVEASPERVRATLQEENLMLPTPRKKPKRNPQKPRFFERATPNQMWQSDIFTFRLCGKNAYLIGFIDDYSRYMVGLDLFRSQTAENMIELFRSAAGEYGVPKEMLTDNGRQYVAWRGKSRFQMELQKDRIQHIRSAPHHPMTLGKIERFWQTIWEEFLGRAQFDSYEAARDRVKLWTKFYNHRRPHQGIGGMCPADRFFEIQHEMKKVIDKGVADNVLEQALRGKRPAPFYMVGRMGSKSVVMRAEKGNLKFEVDGVETDTLECDLEEKPNDGEGKVEGEGDGEGEGGAAPAREAILQRCGESASGVVDLDGETEAVGDLQGTGDQLGEPAALGAPCAGGNDGSVGIADEEGRGTGTGVGDEAPEDAGEEHGEARGTDVKTSSSPVEDTGSEASGGQRIDDEAGEEAGRESTHEVGDDLEGSERTADGDRRGAGAWDLKKDFLRVAEERAGGNGDGFDGYASRPTFRPERLGEGRIEAEVGGDAAGVGAL